MIIENLTEVGKEILEKNGIKVMISVPKGRELGPKTDNPRIGNCWWNINSGNKWNCNAILNCIVCSCYSPAA